jgi:RNA polymerase sigma-32 factor
MWWIKAHIQDYILKSWSLVKIGTTAAQKKLFFSLSKLKNRITNLYARDVNVQDYEDIARDLGVSKKEVMEANERLYSRDVSLNQYVQNDNQNSEMIEFLPDNKPSQEFLVAARQEDSLRKNILLQGLHSLNDRELYIIKSRKLKEPADTLEELSNKFSISKERVRQIENRAFEKLKAYVLDKFDQRVSGTR